jgi:hypothetical protein
MPGCASMRERQAPRPALELVRPFVQRLVTETGGLKTMRKCLPAVLSAVAGYPSTWGVADAA